MASKTSLGAKIRRQEQRLAGRMARKFAPNPTERTAGVVGRNLVAIDGQIYPAEGVDGSGALARVVNVGTPAVARYAPAQRGSVLALGGTGIGGGGTSGGGGTYFAGTGITIDASDYIHVNVSGLADTTRGIGNFSNKFGVQLQESGGLEFPGGYIQLKDNLAGDGLQMIAGKIMQINDSLAGAGLQMGTGKILTLDPAIAGDGLGINPTTKIMNVNVGGDSGLATSADQLFLGESAPIAYGSTWTQTANKSGVVHGHPVTSSATPGETATLLNTDATGKLTLRRAVVDTTYLRGINGARLWWNDTAEPDASSTIKFKAASTSTNDSTLVLQQIPSQGGRIFKILRSDGQELLIIRNDGTLEGGNPPFISGARGWQLRPVGDAEFNNVWVRGELHASVFVVGETHAVGGTLLIATASKLNEEETIGGGSLKVNTEVVGSPGDIRRLKLNTEVVGNPGDIRRAAIQSPIGVLDVDDPPSGHASIFQPGEIVAIQTTYQSGPGGGITSGWFLVLGWEDMTTHYRYMVRREGGTGTLFPAGTAVVSYGEPGDGRILLTSDKNYAPYQDVFITPADPWNGYDPLIRLGRLNGLPFPEIDINIPEFGLATMVNPSDTNAPYSIWSNRRALLKRINLELDNGTFKTVILESGGRVRMGTNAEVASTTGFDFNPVTGVLLIGDKTGDNYLEFNQGTGVLTVKGAITIPAIPDPDWNDLLNKPPRFGDTAGVAGLYVTGSYLGFWDGGAWRAYIQSNGNMGLSKSGSSHALTWNASTGTLTISGSINVLGGNAATQAYADLAEADAIATAAADATTKANNAIATSLVNSNARRVVGVTGDISPNPNGFDVNWSGVTIRFGNGVSKTVTNGSLNIAFTPGKWFLYVDATAGAPLTLSSTTSLSSLGVNHALIAVVDRPSATEAASVTVVGGGTYISGDQIVTGSIRAAQIAAGTITATEIAVGSISADRLSVGQLESLSANTGSLTLKTQFSDTTGYIRTGTKVWDDTQAGIFLGWAGSVARFEIRGTGPTELQTPILKFDGNNLEVRGSLPLKVYVNAGGALAQVIDAWDGNNYGKLYYGLDQWAVDKKFIPYSHATLDLGTLTNKWRNLHISNRVYTSEFEATGQMITGSGVTWSSAETGTTYDTLSVNTDGFTGTIYYFKWANYVHMFARLSKTSNAGGTIYDNIPSAILPQRPVYAPAFWDGQKAAYIVIEDNASGGDIESVGTVLGESGEFVFNCSYLAA